MPNEKGQTLWERYQEKKKQESLSPELKLPFNPLQGRVGDFITVRAFFDEEDLTNNAWILSEIDVWQREIDGETFFFADYVLFDKEGGEAKWFVIRVLPSGDPVANGKPNLQVLLLQQDGSEEEYDESLHDDVSGQTLEVKEDGEVIATYERMGSLEDSYLAEVTCMENPSNPTMDEVEYWDFFRLVGDDGKTFEFYFVELDQRTGMFKFWRGIEIPPTAVSLIPK